MRSNAGMYAAQTDAARPRVSESGQPKLGKLNENNEKLKLQTIVMQLSALNCISYPFSIERRAGEREKRKNKVQQRTGVKEKKMHEKRKIVSNLAYKFSLMAKL